MSEAVPLPKRKRELESIELDELINEKRAV